MRRLLVPAACVAALLIAACGGPSASSPERATAAGGLPELTGMHQLQSAFDSHPGVPRLVILLSPT